MTKADKIENVKLLTAKLKAANNFFITSPSGFTVKEINAFRAACYDSNLELKFFKNKLIRKSLESFEFDFSPVFSELKGQSAIIFSKDFPTLPASVIYEFGKKNPKKPALKAAYVNAEIYTGDHQLDTIRRLKSKSEIIGEISSALLSPLQNVISGITGSGRNISGILKFLEERK